MSNPLDELTELSQELGLYDNTPVVFRCSIPPIGTAIKIAGDGGARILIDIPESELDAIKQLIDLRAGVLIMTAQRASSVDENPKRTIKRWND